MCSSFSSFEYFTDFNCAQRSMWDLKRFIDKWSEQQYSGDVHKESCDTSVVHSETMQLPVLWISVSTMGGHQAGISCDKLTSGL